MTNPIDIDALHQLADSLKERHEYAFDQADCCSADAIKSIANANEDIEQFIRAALQPAKDCGEVDAAMRTAVHATLEHRYFPESSTPKRDEEQAGEEAVERAAKAHCDFFGGEGWWDSGLIADTKPKALEAMRAALAAAHKEQS